MSKDTGTFTIVLHGPTMNFPLFDGSLGQFLFSRMKTKRMSDIVQVDAVTGAEASMGEMFKQSIQTATRLSAMGLKPGDVVLFACRNVPNCFPAALGTVWSGCTLAPIDPAMKLLELKHLFNYYKPNFLFCEEQIADEAKRALVLLDNKAPIFIIDSNDGKKGSYPIFEDLITDEVDLDNYEPCSSKDPKSELAVIITSSGSTGMPKGVGLTHSNVIYQLASWDRLAHIFANHVFLQLTQFFWISGVFTYLSGALIGIKRIILRQFNQVDVFRAIQEHKATFAVMSPAELTSLLVHPDFHKYDLTSIQAITCGGAPLPKAVYLKTKELLGKYVSCTQGYGMTELAGGVCHPAPEEKIESIGTLMMGVSMKVIDITTGKSLGPNKRGEFCYKSPGVMKEYVNNPEATAEAIDKDGWLHSGDLGYYDDEGFLYIVDRIKEFIKFRTWQVPPVEIESLLIELPGVKDVGVAGVPHPEDIYHPMALVVLNKNAKITEQEIIDFVAENLSDHKRLRAGVMFVDQIPRTPTGKIKRPALKELAIAYSYL